MRNKPDYWYKQSAVVPFRRVDSNIQVLLISTRKKKKWIFPKGIIEENHSAKTSAVKEAMEEAGVIGEIKLPILGTYTYQKWGGKCKVKVYALKVLKVLDEWEENFRERKWVNIENVSTHIHDDELLRIINTLIAEINDGN